MTPVQLARSGFLALLFSTLSPAGAATLTWTGAGVNAGWATGGNWAEGAYANGNDLIFTGASRPVSYMVNASTVNSLTFSNGASAAFTVRLEANSGAARVLTFQAANTGITVQSAVTNVHTIGLTSGSITLLGDLTVSQNSTNNFSIIRPIDGSFGLIKNGVGPLILSGTNNTFTGGLTLNAGTVSLNHPSVLGGGTFTIAGGTIDNTSGNAISNINNNAQSWNADPVFTGTSDLNLGTGAVTLGANRLVTVAAGGLTVGGGISGAFTLTKAGAGSLTLGGANTYTGHTTVSNGTLLVNGSLAGAVALNSAVAKLGGSGTINGSVTNVGGSQILPGDSGAKGTLTVTGDLVLNGGSLVYEINDNDNADKIVVGGNLAVNAATVLNVTQPGFPYLTNGDYALMEVTGAFGGTNNFSLALTPSPPPSKVFSLVFDAASAPKKVILRVAPGSTADLSWVGGSGGNVWNNSTANWTNALNGGPLVAFTPAAIATFDSTGSANPLVNISAAVAPATVTVNAATDYAFFGAGGITGTNSLTKIGAGTLTISNANSFTGVVNLNEGTLLVANAAALGATNGLVSVGLDIATNATLALAGGITVGAKPLALRGDGAVAGTGALRNLGGTNIWGGDVTLTTSIATRIVSDAGKLVIAGNVTNGGSGALLLGGAGAGEIGGKISGAGGVSKSATGTWTLSGANNYSGATSVSSGVLALTGSLTNTANVTVDGGAFANAGVLNAGTAALFTGTAASSRGIINLTAGSITVNNAEAGLVATASGALNVSGGTFTTTQAAIGEDNFRIGKVGYGAFTLSGGTVNVQRFQSQGGTGATGIALVSGGTLNVTEVLTVGRNGAAGGQGVLTVSGGTVNHANATGAINVGNASGVRGEVNLIGGIINNSGQTISFGAGSGTASGIVNLDAGTLITGSFLSLDGVNAVNFGGATLQAAANTAVFLPATLPAYINGPFGAFAGGAVIDTAGFNVTNAASLLTPVGNGVSGISLATEGSGYIGAPYVAIAGDGSGATAIAEMTTDGTGDGTLKVAVIRITNPGINYSTAPTVTLSGGAPTAAAAIGTVTLAANTSGGLVKLGAGALTLAGANTYTGATTVSNGTLQIAGSLAGGGVAVQSGGTLGGGGSIGGPVTVASGAALAPDANAITTLTLNSNLTLAAGSGTFLKVDQANGTNDVVAGLTNVIFGGTLTVTNLGGTFTGGESYQLFHAAGYAGNFSATNLPALGGGLKWVWTPTNGTLAVVSGTATTATNLEFNLSGSTLALGWPESHRGWFAQSNSVNVAGSNYWFDITGSDAVTNLNITISPAATNVFYRLRAP